MGGGGGGGEKPRSTHIYGRLSLVKTTLEIPDPLLRQAKAAAAARGESLKELVSTAIRSHLAGPGKGENERQPWRRVVGLATREEVAEIDAIIDAEFEEVDPADWK